MRFWQVVKVLCFSVFGDMPAHASRLLVFSHKESDMLELFLAECGAVLVAVLRPGVPFYRNPTTYEANHGPIGKLVIVSADNGNTRIYRMP